MGNKLHITALIAILLIITSTCFADPAPVNLDFIDTDIRTVFYTLATIGGVNIVVDDTIKGTITLKLSDMPFYKALDVITKSKGMSYRKIDNTIIIESADVGVTEAIKLNYARATELKKALDPIATGLKLKVEADDTSNALLFTGSPAGLDRIKGIIADLDLPQKQVELEAQVVAISKTNTKDLGIDWSWDKTPTFPEYEPATYGWVQNPNTGTYEWRQTNPATVTRPANTGVIRYGRSPEGLPYEFYYQAKINALVSNGNAKVLAKPKVSTVNGKEARILIGDRIPVLVEKTDNGKTTDTVEYVDAGIKLTYTPRVNSDGSISASVRTEVSSPTMVAEMKNYKITTREADTNVCVKDGETIIIGGLIGSDESETGNKVPFLGDIPILGKLLFTSQHNSKNDTEVVIFLTAKVAKAK